MRIKYCKHIPFKGYAAITFLWWCIVRKDCKNYVNDRLIRHESTHSYQQITLFVTALIVTNVLHAFIGIPWYVYTIGMLSPFIIYVLCWIIELIIPPYDRAYLDICFEGEARELENDINYANKLYPFSFIKYIKNKKYGGR